MQDVHVGSEKLRRSPTDFYAMAGAPATSLILVGLIGLVAASTDQPKGENNGTDYVVPSYRLDTLPARTTRISLENIGGFWSRT